MPMQRMQRAALVLTLLVLLLSLSLSMGVAEAQQSATVSGQVGWSPDGKLLAVANWRGLTLYDVTFQPVSPSITSVGSITSFSWSPDSRYLVTTQFDAVARIWDAQTGQLVRTLEGHSERLTQAVWSPNNAGIATSSYDRSVRIWDVATGKNTGTARLVKAVPAGITWAPGSKRILAASASVREEGLTFEGIFIWELTFLASGFSNGFENTSGGPTIHWNDDPSYFMINGSIVEFNIGKVVFRPPVGSPLCSFTRAPTAATWSNDGTRAVYANAEGETGPKIVCVIDVTGQAPSKSKQVMLARVQDTSFKRFGSVAISPDKSLVAALSDDGSTLFGWEVATGKQISPLNLGTPTAVTPTSKVELISVCSADKANARRWKVRNPNAFAVAFKWVLKNSPPKTRQLADTLVVPAAVGSTPGEATFETPIEGYINTLSIYSPADVLQDTKEAIQTPCPATPTPSPRATR